MTKFIFILGGVISGLGKGVTSGSIGAIFKEMGYNNITIKKLDPYLNIDPGTMNPIEHGEVYVTRDGGETDLDLGYYERFAEINVTKKNSISSGKLFYNLLQKERKGDFLGKTVQLIPHFTDSIKEFILDDSDKYDIIICEVGGSAGDFEAGPFFESIRQLKNELPKKDIIIALVSYIVYYKASKELKTKPTQVAIRQLMQMGLQPDILFARTEYPLTEGIKKKLSLYSNVKIKDIIEGLNVSSIYKVPLKYKEEGLINSIESLFKIKQKKIPKFEKWIKLNNTIDNLKNKVRIGIVGKYVELEDSYYSVIESLNHAGWYYNTSVELEWINARKTTGMIKQLKSVDGVLVPGGFGTSGIEEIISAIKYCRLNKIPLLGICLGMQLSVIEFGRNVVGIKNASSSEFGKKGDVFIVDLMTEWEKESGHVATRSKDSNLGGTLRLGSYDTVVNKDSLAYKLYKKTNFKERHRHRYEVDIKYKDQYEKKGMIFSGISPDGKLPEIIEIPKHPFFIAGQFHPEFNSNPFQPHPLFKGLIKSVITKIIKN